MTGSGSRPAAHAGRYYARVGAIEAGLVRMAEDALTVLRQPSQPLGPMGADWLAQQERRLNQA